MWYTEKTNSFAVRPAFNPNPCNSSTKSPRRQLKTTAAYGSLTSSSKDSMSSVCVEVTSTTRNMEEGLNSSNPNIQNLTLCQHDEAQTENATLDL